MCVGAVGTPPLSYQWRYSGTDIAGATNSCLVMTNAGWSQAAAYSVRVRNPFGTNDSATALLTMLDVKMYAGLTIAGVTGVPYTVQYVNALQPTNGWQTITTNLMLMTSPYLFIDPESPNARNRFYRAFPTP